MTDLLDLAWTVAGVAGAVLWAVSLIVGATDAPQPFSGGAGLWRMLGWLSLATHRDLPDTWKWPMTPQPRWTDMLLPVDDDTPTDPRWPPKMSNGVHK